MPNRNFSYLDCSLAYYNTTDKRKYDQPGPSLSFTQWPATRLPKSNHPSPIHRHFHQQREQQRQQRYLLQAVQNKNREHPKEKSRQSDHSLEFCFGLHRYSVLLVLYPLLQ